MPPNVVDRDLVIEWLDLYISKLTSLVLAHEDAEEKVKIGSQSTLYTAISIRHAIVSGQYFLDLSAIELGQRVH